MKSAVQSGLKAGAAVVGASAIAIAPVQPPPGPTPAPTVQLAAAVEPLALEDQPPLVTVLLNSPLALLGPAAPLGTLPPAPAPLAIAIAPNLADTIDGIYIEVEKWVQYGFEVATAVVRWIPYVGWFAGYIMDGYFFVESMVASGVFNFTDWLRGNGGIVENLVDFGVDVGLAFVWLGLDALDEFIPLPPFCCYPPHPPLEGPFLALQQAEIEQTVAPADGESEPETPLQQLRDRVAASVDAATSILSRTVDVVTGTVTDNEVEPDAVAPAHVVDAADDVTPVTDRTIANLRRDKVVEIRGGVTKAAVEDVSQAARSGQRGALRQAVPDGVTNGVKKAADRVQKAGDGIRKATEKPKK